MTSGLRKAESTPWRQRSHCATRVHGSAAVEEKAPQPSGGACTCVATHGPTWKGRRSRAPSAPARMDKTGEQACTCAVRCMHVARPVARLLPMLEPLRRSSQLRVFALVDFSPYLVIARSAPKANLPRRGTGRWVGTTPSGRWHRSFCTTASRGVFTANTPGKRPLGAP